MISRLVLTISVVLLTGCAVARPPSSDTELTVEQHSIVLDSIINYIEALQARGMLPKLEEEAKDK